MLAYQNLDDEMKRKHVLRSTLSKTLSITRRTVGLKIKGDYSFTLDEAKKIHKVYFPELEFLYLFNRSDEQP